MPDGHIGDGNVHLNILKPEALASESFFKQCGDVSERVFEVVHKYGGSVSAEHGVGLLKKSYLHYSKSPDEIAYMKAVKKIFDPKNIMNPGKLLLFVYQRRLKLRHELLNLEIFYTVTEAKVLIERWRRH